MTPDRFVLDTSVALAWYLPDVFAPAARTWQAGLLAGTAILSVPSLHYWEFANALRTRVRRGELKEALAEEIFQLHLAAPLLVAEPEHQTLLKIALNYDATAYDAVYIALGLQLGAALLTAERSTTPWVVQLKNKAISIS